MGLRERHSALPALRPMNRSGAKCPPLLRFRKGPPRRERLSARRWMVEGKNLGSNGLQSHSNAFPETTILRKMATRTRTRLMPPDHRYGWGNCQPISGSMHADVLSLHQRRRPASRQAPLAGRASIFGARRRGKPGQGIGDVVGEGREKIDLLRVEGLRFRRIDCERRHQNIMTPQRQDDA